MPTKIGTEFQVNTQVGGDSQAYSATVGLANGNFVVSYGGGDGVSGYSLK